MDALARTVCACVLVAAAAGCRREPPARSPAATAFQPPPSGTVRVDGIQAPVSIARDAAGVPHIVAANEDDLFFAQGYVQAQDRLFQMDLWRRSVQGRLSEVLGANFIERDAMTRRVQYRGPVDAEWESYGPRTKTIAAAFTRGINEWVRHARDEVPEEFALAGWRPELWSADDLLNRTDAFLASGDATDEVLRARLISAVGVPLADAIWPPDDGGRTRPPAGVDLGAVNYSLGDLLRRVGTAPFFSALWAPVGGPAAPDNPRRSARPGSGSNAWAVAAARTRGHRALLAADPHRPFTAPSLRYLVHLSAPGWNVIGATAPWLPGVAIGHNDAVAWAYAAAPVDVQDLFVEKLNPANERQVQFQGRWVDVQVEHDRIAVKGRREPFEYDRLYTRHGVVIGLDRERHLAYTLRWSGAEPGTAGELASLAIDRTASIAELRAALARWKMPAADFVFADRAGNIGGTRAALSPRRLPGAGRVPSPGWTGSSEWRGWTRDASGDAADPPSGFLAVANGNLARVARINTVLSSADRADVAGMAALQKDVAAWNAERLVPLLSHVERVAQSEALARARSDLLGWDRRMSADSTAASLYARWESALRRLLIEHRIPPPLRDDFSTRRWSTVPILEHPTRAWFDGDPVAGRDGLLVDALAAAVQERTSASSTAWGAEHQVAFVHPLAITDAARRRFNVGPFALPGYADTVFAATTAIGPALRMIVDVGEWDRSVVANAPGQSESPGSTHFSDLARLWAAGDYAPMPFSEAAVRSNAAATLVLTPLH